MAGGILDQVRGRKIHQVATNGHDIHEDEKDPKAFEDGVDSSGSSTLSVEAQNEKEVQQHPGTSQLDEVARLKTNILPLQTRSPKTPSWV